MFTCGGLQVTLCHRIWQVTLTTITANRWLTHLKRAAMFDGPDTESNGRDRDAEERNKHQDPHHLVNIIAEFITGQQFKHE